MKTLASVDAASCNWAPSFCMTGDRPVTSIGGAEDAIASSRPVVVRFAMCCYLGLPGLVAMG
ncbi:hypothetical protein D3C71_1302350 [compost metagenome]